LGGGIRGNRPKYAKTSGGGQNISQFSGSGVRQVFISFHINDEAQVELLRQQSKDPRFNIEFIDYSVKEPFDERWKTRCTERIKRSSLFICMIGPETYKREAVLWEINKAHELGKKVIGVKIYRNENHRVPEPLVRNNDKIIYWNIDDISREIDNV